MSKNLKWGKTIYILKKSKILSVNSAWFFHQIYSCVSLLKMLHKRQNVDINYCNLFLEKFAVLKHNQNTGTLLLSGGQWKQPYYTIFKTVKVLAKLNDNPINNINIVVFKLFNTFNDCHELLLFHKKLKYVSNVFEK